MKNSFIVSVLNTLRNHISKVNILRNEIQDFLHDNKEFIDEEAFDDFFQFQRKIIDETDDALFSITIFEDEILNPKPNKKEDLNENIRTLVSSQSSFISEGVNLDLAKGFPLLYCDKQEIDYIFSNLISNSENAFGLEKKGFKIDISTRFKKENNDQYIEIRFKDNAKGIPEELLKDGKLWEKGESGTFYGTGLGLYLVKKVVEEHGGTIDVESEKGVGSTFIIRFPVDKDIGPKVQNTITTEEKAPDPDKNFHASKLIEEAQQIYEETFKEHNREDLYTDYSQAAWKVLEALEYFRDNKNQVLNEDDIEKAYKICKAHRPPKEKPPEDYYKKMLDPKYRTSYIYTEPFAELLEPYLTYADLPFLRSDIISYMPELVADINDFHQARFVTKWLRKSKFLQKKFTEDEFEQMFFQANHYFNFVFLAEFEDETLKKVVRELFSLGIEVTGTKTQKNGNIALVVNNLSEENRELLKRNGFIVIEFDKDKDENSDDIIDYLGFIDKGDTDSNQKKWRRLIQILAADKASVIDTHVKDESATAEKKPVKKKRKRKVPKVKEKDVIILSEILKNAPISVSFDDVFIKFLTEIGIDQQLITAFNVILEEISSDVVWEDVFTEVFKNIRLNQQIMIIRKYSFVQEFLSIWRFQILAEEYSKDIDFYACFDFILNSNHPDTIENKLKMIISNLHLLMLDTSGNIQPQSNYKSDVYVDFCWKLSAVIRIRELYDELDFVLDALQAEKNIIALQNYKYFAKNFPIEKVSDYYLVFVKKLILGTDEDPGRASSIELQRFRDELKDSRARKISKRKKWGSINTSLSDNDAAITKRLSQIIKKKEISVQKLVELTGRREIFCEDIVEGNARRIESDLLCYFSQLLDVEICWLLTGSSEEKVMKLPINDFYTKHRKLLGIKLKILRLKIGLSIEDVMSQIRTKSSKPHILNLYPIESGERSISEKDLKLLLEIYDIEMDEILAQDSSKRVVVDLIKSSELNNILNSVSEHLEGQPVDIFIKLNLIPKEDLQMNMRTWAYIALLQRKKGLDINYIFIPSNRASKVDPMSFFWEAVDEITNFDEDKIKKLRQRINNKHKYGNPININIIQTRYAPRAFGFTSNNIYVCLLSKPKYLTNIEIPDSVSAVISGLSQAVCLKAYNDDYKHGYKDINKAGPIFKERVKEVLPTMRRIYERHFSKEDVESIINERTMWLLVSDSREARKELSLMLALPPLVVDIAKALIHYHDMVHDLLRAA